MEFWKIYVAVELDGNFEIFVTGSFLFRVSKLLNIFVCFQIHKYIENWRFI